MSLQGFKHATKVFLVDSSYSKKQCHFEFSSLNHLTPHSNLHVFCMQIKCHVHTRQTKILKLNSLFLNHDIKLLTSFYFRQTFQNNSSLQF